MRTTMLPVPPTSVPARATERIQIAPLQAVLICTVHIPDNNYRVSVQPLFNLDNSGPRGIEHRIIARAEALPVLLINYENRALIIRAVFHCIDGAGKSLEQLFYEHQQWCAMHGRN